MPRLLAVDPSTTFTGWSVFHDEGLVAWGKIDATNLQIAIRFVFIVEQFVKLVERYGIQEVAIEDVSFAWHSKHRNRNIAGLQIVFRAIKETTETARLPFHPINPGTWKYAVVGNAAANKEITRNNILLRFPRVPGNLSDHEYDAIAIGVYQSAISGIYNGE